MSNNSNQSLIKGFGLDAELKSQTMEPDLWATNLVREVGKTMAPVGMTYQGSAVVHYYYSTLARELSTINMIVGQTPGSGLGDDLSENSASFGIADLALKLRQHYNPEHRHKTTNKKDQR